jgi:hypothetical protein
MAEIVPLNLPKIAHKQELIPLLARSGPVRAGAGKIFVGTHGEEC